MDVVDDEEGVFGCVGMYTKHRLEPFKGGHVEIVLKKSMQFFLFSKYFFIFIF